MWKIITILVVVSIAGLLMTKLRNARDRRRHLDAAGRVMRWEQLQSKSGQFQKIVQINFGYGNEI